MGKIKRQTNQRYATGKIEHVQRFVEMYPQGVFEQFDDENSSARPCPIESSSLSGIFMNNTREPISEFSASSILLANNA
jgi:hypothetical protein